MKSIMKKTIAILSLVFALILSSNAQVFVIDGDGSNPRVPAEEEFDINNPGNHGSGDDWYLPIGGGALLLAALGGAYLFGKKRNK